MKLRNKKAGEIEQVHLDCGYIENEVNMRAYTAGTDYADCHGRKYHSLAELNEEWEDYEEPKEYWYITDLGCVGRETEGKLIESRKACGNHFETKEEAEETVERLKAWVRLRDKGFRFLRDAGGRPYFGYYPSETRCIMTANESKMCDTDLNLLFGGEE